MVSLVSRDPDLTAHDHGESHADMDMQTAAARQFWIIKQGIKATGMPAWGTTRDDGAIWGLVALFAETARAERTRIPSDVFYVLWTRVW